jgi:hypothetical protein
MTYRDRLDDIDRAIVTHVDQHQPTTFRDTATAAGLSLAPTYRRCLALIDRGLLTHAPGVPRTLRCDPSVVVIPGRGVHQMERIG